MNRKIAVFGAGSWGTALAIHLARQGCQVRLWTHSRSQARALVRDSMNSRYLPGVAFPSLMKMETAIRSALKESDFVLIAVPSKAFKSMVERLARAHNHVPLFWATKGLDPLSSRPLHETVEAVFGKNYPSGIISGPSFAAEVARGLPTALTVAANSTELAAQFGKLLHGSTFRAYTSTDVLGVELGGATKNVIAIATGIGDGLGFGANARAALVTRGLAELRRLGHAMGARERTLMGLSGLGDLVLTCTDDQSRNRRLGLALGRGESQRMALQRIGQSVEGIEASASVMHLAQSISVEMPITEAVYEVIHSKVSPRSAVESLMNRAMKNER